MNNLITGSPSPDQQPPSSAVNPEHEKKFLPSANFPLPKLPQGIKILQFYFPSTNIVISGNDLFYKDGKTAFLNLNEADLAMAKLFLSSPKPPKARIRISEYKNQQQAFFNMKLDQRMLPGQFTTSTTSTESQTPGTADQSIIRNLEFERPMSVTLAEKFYYRFGGQTHRVIAKTRHLIHHNFRQPDGSLLPHYSNPFEIDIFHGPDDFTPRDRKIANNSGLKMIELELGVGEIFDPAFAPPWLGEDITHDKRFTNSKLSQNPFAKWAKKDQPTVLRNT